MYDTFYLPRFGRLLKKTLLERPMQLFGFTGAVMLLLFLYYAIFHLPPGQWIERQKDAFLFGLTGGGTILASFIFGYFSTNAQGSSYLTLPASHFEKWLCAVLITGVLYPAVFLGFFRIMDLSFIGWFHHHLDTTLPNYKQLYDLVQVFPFDHPTANTAVTYFLIYAGAMLVGSLYFNKVSIIKVALIIGGVFLAIYFVNLLIAKLLIDHMQNAFPFDSVDIQVLQTSAGGVVHGFPRQLDLPLKDSKILDIISKYFLSAALWIIAYVRLREKEF
jgi:MFS family permease